jgi:arylsulfatase A-like enzyme
MRWCAGVLAAIAVGLPLSARAQVRDPARPNVVLIITGDMGWGDLGSYGASDIKTPSIDSLARDGVRLTSFYSNGAFCTPTRAGLISGRYQQRYGLEMPLTNDGNPGSERGLTATGRSLPQLLKTNNYATALVGKWHLGYRPEHSPEAHGFDYFFGLKSGYHDFYAHSDGNGKPDLWEDGRAIEASGYTTDLITQRANVFIERNAARSFFLEVAYNAPHWPYQVPDRPSVAPGHARHLMPSDEGASTRADYVAMVERVDGGVGRILQTLDRLGLASNTIVIFTNDNGGEWLSTNGPFFNRKGTVWEGGIRVPALIRWPGRIPPGTVSGQVGITMDLTASILAATGTAVPADARLEGMNLFPILEGRTPEVERTLFWRTSTPNRVQKAVRHGDWKLVLDGNHTFIFDVRTDLGERQDLASRRQDIARKLRVLIADWEREVDAEAPAPRQAQSPVEEIYIARSLRESRTAPSAFCSAERTGFGNPQFEDRYTFRSIATRTSDGRVTDANVQVIGHLRGCVGQTADPLIANFYAEGQLAGVSLTAVGQCRAPRADHPERGTTWSACSFELRNVPSPYVSGRLTTSTMTSRQAIGGVSDPAGYVQPSIATVRLWKGR